jgi:hypothetical protein
MTVRRLVCLGLAVGIVTVWMMVSGLGDRASLPPVPRVTPTSTPRPANPVAAATAFLTSLTPRVVLDAGRRRALLDRWADPSARRSLEQTYEAEAERVRATYGGAPLVSRSALLGYRTARRPGHSIDVVVWAVGVAAGAAGAGAAGWSTVTVRLNQRDAGWRVVAVTAQPGPDPALPAQRLAQAVASFRPFLHVR